MPRKMPNAPAKKKRIPAINSAIIIKSLAAPKARVAADATVLSYCVHRQSAITAEIPL
jgi:hypothetical protein